MIGGSSACSGDLGPSQGGTGTIAQAIAGGHDDVDEAHRNASVYLETRASAGIGHCTGTIISPVRVLTARHCLQTDVLGLGFSSGWRLEESGFVNIGLSSGAHSIAFHSDYAHTPLSDVTTPEQQTKDLAVVALESRFDPSWNVEAVHPGLDATSCPISFTGIFSGYGLSRINSAGSCIFEDLPHYPRKVGEDCLVGGGSVYNGVSSNCNGSTAPGFAGTCEGDSGGPLFHVDGAGVPDFVCGALSGPPAGSPDIIASVWAPTNTSDNAAFIRDAAIDKFGNWIGDCSAGGPDTDGDGIPDRCDDCPTIANSDQHDRDSDGKGDICDDCLADPNGDQSDTNLSAEIEVALAAPGGDQRANPPSEDYLTNDFPGDACDTNPVAIMSTTDEAYLSHAPRTIPCPVIPGEFCSPPTGKPPMTACPVARNNLLHATSLIGGAASEVLATTAVRRCACVPAAGDPFCNSTCSRKDLRLPAAVWHAMSLEDPTTHAALNLAPTDPALRDLVATDHPNVKKSVALAAEADWGWNYPRDVPGFTSPFTLPAPGATNPVFDGVVWLWVRSYASGTTPPPATDPTGDDTMQRLRQTVSELHVSEYGPPASEGPPCETFVPVEIVGFLGPDWKPPPPTGGFDLSSVLDFNIPGDPAASPTVTVDSPFVGVRDVTTNFDPHVINAVTHGGQVLVSNSDVVGYSTGRAFGALVDPTAQIVSGVLALHGSVLVAEPPSPQFPRLMDPPLVVASSGRRQEIAFFNDRGVDGALLPQVRVFDYDLRTTTLRPTLGDERLHNPVAATYRAEDDAYYLLDLVEAKSSAKGGKHDDDGKDEGDDETRSRIRLVRMPRGLTVELVAQWPARHPSKHFGMTTGADGGLVVSCSSEKRYSVGLLSLDPDGSLHLRAFLEGHDGLAIPAFKGHDALLAVRSRKGVPQHVDAVLDGRRRDPDERIELSDLAECF